MEKKTYYIKAAVSKDFEHMYNRLHWDCIVSEFSQVSDHIFTVAKVYFDSQLEMAYTNHKTDSFKDYVPGVANFITNFLSASIGPDGFVYYFKSYRDYENLNYTKQKLGRFIREFGVCKEDAFIEYCVQKVKEEIKVFSGYTIHVDRSFQEVYKMVPHEYMGNLGDYSSLPDSCMQNKAKFNDLHPAEAYNSGDFKIAYILSSDGVLLARTVFRVSNASYAPIYTCSKFFGDILKKYLEENFNAYEADRRDWCGAKIKPVVSKYCGGYIYMLPYLDLSLYVSEDFELGYESHIYYGCHDSTSGYMRRIYPEEYYEDDDVYEQDDDDDLVDIEPDEEE